MKVIDYINKSKETILSYEVLPPLKGKNIHSLFQHLDPLMEFKPSFINVTYHRSEHVSRQQPDGSVERIEIRKRPGTVGICAAIMNHYQVDAVPHLICGGFTKRETEDALIDLNFLGIDNVLVLRGDTPKGDVDAVYDPKGNRYAIDLLRQAERLNNGLYLDEEILDGFKTNFCLGVAGYPEKHIEATSLETDLVYLKEKVDAGAEYIVTQMFFDNSKYFDFVAKCRAAGIDVPIIPGLKPLTNKKQLTGIPRIFNLELPQDLINAMNSTTTDEAAEKVGEEWLVDQSKELKKAGVPVLHYYTLGKPRVIYNAVSQIF